MKTDALRRARSIERSQMRARMRALRDQSGEWIGARFVLLLSIVVALAFVVTCAMQASAQDLGSVDRELTPDERCEFGNIWYYSNVRPDLFDAAYDYNGDTDVTAADFSAWVDQLDDDTDPPPPPPPPPPSGGYDWWPGDDALSLGARDAEEVASAFDRLGGVGGFLTLETRAAVNEFVRRVDQGGGLAGRPDRRVVVRTAPGVVIDRQLRNTKGQLRDVAFDRVPFTPVAHQNTFAVRIAGDCDRVAFLACDFAGWRQVIEGQDAGVDADGQFIEPDDVWFVGGSWTRIFNASHPVTTHANQNDKNARSQGAWWQGRRWVFRDLAAVGVGWDIAGDPDRRRTDKYSQILYGSQNARDTLVEGCVFDGTSNNAVVMKGTGLTVRDTVFDRCVNAIGFGTAESPRWPCSAFVEDVKIRRLVPLCALDDPSLPDAERVRADSGVAMSLLNFDGVVLRRVRFVGPNAGTRAALMFINNGQSTNVSASGLVVEGCDAGDLPLCEIRDFRVPSGGLSVRVTGTASADDRVLVRSTLTAGGAAGTASGVLADFLIDGEKARGR